MSQRIEAKLLVDCKNHLGEGIQWSAERQRVYWPDIFGNVLQSCDENGGAIESLELETGLTAFGFTRTGRAIASFVDGICWLDMETGEREMLYPFQPDNPKTRLNDGGLDRQGRFLVGGMDEVDTTAIAPMLSVTPEGVRAIMQGIAISNSLAFSPDGKTMYFTAARMGRRSMRKAGCGMQGSAAARYSATCRMEHRTFALTCQCQMSPVAPLVAET